MITWDYVAKTKLFSGKGNKCNLCLLEKFVILKHIDNANLLSKRSELMISCIHRSEYLLKYLYLD